jgi:type IV pilus assembly protein PilV
MKRLTYKTGRFGTSNASGFTLIEVMIAVLVLSVGLLGLAAMQAFGLRNNQEAYMRSQATILAGDIMERMRANIQGVNAGHYNLGTPSAVAACLTTTGCTAQQLAQQDMFEWRTSMFNALPTPTPTNANLGEAVVCIDSTPLNSGTSVNNHGCDGIGNVYAVKIWWDTNRDGGMDGYFWTSFQP